jgi:hypothetical protein
LVLPVRQARKARKSSDPMRVSAIPVLLPSRPCTTDIAAGLLIAQCLARLVIDPEDGGETFLLNAVSHTDYTALYPRRW